MGEDKPSSNISATTLATIMVALGVYGFWHGTIESPRPYSLAESLHLPAPADTHKVESRLWQDPFEAFESATNQTGLTTGEARETSPNGAIGQPATASPMGDRTFWEDLNARAANSNGPIAIMAVMLDGGTYPEDKEVRLRLRYAVEVASLTSGLGPDDRTHISTNSVWLPARGNGDTGQFSRIACEWFGSRNDVHPLQTCVLWLNEDDFADDPAWHLGSLMKEIPALTDPKRSVTFYLIGPRSSDTLKALTRTDTNSANFSGLQTAARLGHFHLMSPEATAAANTANFGDPEGTYARQNIDAIFGTNVFHNWIASDQKLASLLARELQNRVVGSRVADKTNNVVVLLSEEDTYYGSKLKLEWTEALVRNQVCLDASQVWPFAYLRGLDGSKPQAKPADANQSTNPEGALEDNAEKQRTGNKADGDAQLDYIVRLGEFLARQDKALKSAGTGRIIAVGFTGSDVYDKLILIRELRDRLPEAVFFTTDLDAPLWTTSELKYTRNLLVASAYPLDPEVDHQHHALTQFEPFRDVYQRAVFMACASVIAKENSGGTTGLQANPAWLAGGLYEIGRHGPVPISAIHGREADTNPGARNIGRSLFHLNFKTIGAALANFTAVCGVLVFFMAAFRDGFQLPWTRKIAAGTGEKVREAEQKERGRQMAFHWLLACGLGVSCLGLAGWAFLRFAERIATLPGEEPWSFLDGVSIWPTECVRVLAFLLAGLFFPIALYRYRQHCQTLWENYFWDGKSGRKNWRRIWKTEEPATKREASLIFGWMPPFVEKPGEKEASVDMLELFRHYFRLGRFLKRLGRSFGCWLVYVLVLVLGLSFSNDLPTLLNIRGPNSHALDVWLVSLGSLLTLFVLFYVLDGTLLNKRLLDCLCRYSTSWPDQVRRRFAVEYGVRPNHVEGLLEVDFAAFQTQELGVFMLWPLLLILILTISRSSWLDNWTWPPALILIYASNFSAAVICWWIVRRSAAKVRQFALDQLDEFVRSAEDSDRLFDKVLVSEKPDDDSTTMLTKKTYLSHLEVVRQKILDEQRGAFAKWFQDPTFLAVFIPSGISGLIPLLSVLWPGK